MKERMIDLLADGIWFLVRHHRAFFFLSGVFMGAVFL